MAWLLSPLVSDPGAISGFWRLLRVMLRVDFLLLLAYAVAVGLFWAGVTPRLVYALDVGADRSVAEWANYLKWLACLPFLLRAWHVRREAVLLACLPLFLGILIDDSFQYHESRGPIYERLFALQPVYGLGASGIGQLIAFGLMVAVSAVILGVGLALSTSRGRAIGLRFLALFAALIFMAVGVDALHDMVAALDPRPYGGPAGLLLTALEEGGELVLASVLLAYCAALSRPIAPVP